MLNRCIQPLRFPPSTHSSIQPCPPLPPFTYKFGRSVAGLVSYKKVNTGLTRRRHRGASIGAPFGSAKILDDPKQGQKQSSRARHFKLVSNSKFVTYLDRVRKSHKNTAPPARPLRVPPREQSRKRCAQSQVKGHTRDQLFRSVIQWQPSKDGGRRRGGQWFRRLNRIEKPSRSSGAHKPKRRPQFISLGPWPNESSWSSHQPTTDTLEEINWEWCSNFQTLKIPEEMQKWTDVATNHVMQHYWGIRSGRNHVNKAWLGFRGYTTEKLWRNVMLWCLKHRKKQALMLLLVTLKGRRYRPPRYVVSDCLTVLARHFLFKVSNPSRMAIDAIWLLTCRFIEGARGQDRHFRVPQNLIYCILQHSDDSRVLLLYGLLGLNKVILHVNTMLHFLNRFLDMGKINSSMKLLDIIAKTKFDLSSNQIQMACVKLLRAQFGTEEEYIIRSNILTQILEMGIRPKLHMYNTILLNACEGGDFANAWQMYGLARENAIVPDSITHGVLLKGAILSGDFSNLKMVIQEIQENKYVLTDLRLIADVMHAISLLSPGDEFGTMLDFYKQHCDLRPIHELSLCGDEIEAPPHANGHGVWPTSYILTRLILAYVHLHQGSPDLIDKYNLYYQLVKEGHPLIAPLAQIDIVANSFILAFGKNASTLQHCTTVVRHMLEFSSPDFATIGSVPYAAPTTQTWSILVAAYFGNRQQGPAKKVIEMMRERGIKGNKVTWNILIAGYASMQDVDATMDAVEGMKVAGFEADSFTIKGLSRLRTKDRLMQALQTNMAERCVDKRTVEGVVPSPDLEETHEADMGPEWEPNTLTREKVLKYSRANY